jgi:hypothetical protein
MVQKCQWCGSLLEWTLDDGGVAVEQQCLNPECPVNTDPKNLPDVKLW